MSNLTKDEKNAKFNQSLVHIRHIITHRQYKYWHLMIMFFAEKIERGEYPDQHGFYFESREKIARYMGYHPSTKELKADIDALVRKPIVINYLEKNGKQATRGMSFISEYEITSNRIGFVLPSFIKDAIMGDDESKKMFLFLNWDILGSLKGKYETIIYKLCKDYIGVGRTPYFTIQQYRDYVGLKDEEYKALDNLTKRCIKNPILNINKNKDCDIEVEVVPEKNGRSVVGLYFKMKYKKQASLPFSEFEPITVFTKARIAISKDQQVELLNIYTEEQIEAIIERANEYIEQLKAQGKTVQMGAIYNKAFRENWGAARLEEKKINEQEQLEKQEKLKAKKREAELKQQAEQQQLMLTDELISDFDSYDLKTKRIIIEKMLNRIKPVKPLYRKFLAEYEEHGENVSAYSNAFKGNLVTEIKDHQAVI